MFAFPQCFAESLTLRDFSIEETNSVIIYLQTRRQWEEYAKGKENKNHAYRWSCDSFNSVYVKMVNLR